MSNVQKLSEEIVDKENKGLLWKPIGERVFFSDRDGSNFEFVDYWPKTSTVHLIRAWIIKAVNDMGLCYFPVQAVGAEELKRLEIWDLLPESIRQDISGSDIKQEVIVQDRMDHARKHRVKNPELAGLPSVIKCSKCGGEKNVIPAQILKRAKAKNITPEEFIKVFVCLTCDPSQRGKKVSAKYANMTKELKCTHEGCCVTKIQHPSATEKAAGVAGLTFAEYVAAWKCKEHKEKRVHQFSKEGMAARGVTGRGRKPNPLFANIPKEVTCKGCGVMVKVVPQQLVIKAGKLKKDVMELVNDYRCRKCGGRITEAKIKEAKKEAKKKAKG